jgi:transcriptional regulator with XRE-family HTH domain
VQLFALKNNTKGITFIFVLFVKLCLSVYLSRNLEFLLHEKKMKKSDLARILEVSHRQATKYVSGENQPKIEALIILGELFDIAIDDLILVDLSKNSGRRFGEGAADKGPDVEEQTKELNRLLRLRLERVEAAIKKDNPDLAAELGIE